MIPFFKRRRLDQNTTPTIEPPAALALIEATFIGAEMLTLRFNRPINADAADASAIWIRDGINVLQYTGINVSVTGPETIQIEMMQDGEAFDPGVRLDVYPENGIVDLQGNAWAGTMNLLLPFGA